MLTYPHFRLVNGGQRTTYFDLPEAYGLNSWPVCIDHVPFEVSYPTHRDDHLLELILIMNLCQFVH
jgi:hypothetical protein